MAVVPSPAEVRSRLRRPTAVYAIIAINAAVALYTQSLPIREYNRFLANWALIPARFTRADQAPFGDFISSPRLATLVTSLFLHGGLAHIALNMFLLFAIGRTLELAIGAPRFVLLYMLAGLGSSVAVILLYRDSLSPFIGASGAVYGVMGAYFLLLPTGPDRRKTLIWTLALITLPALIPKNIIEGITGSDFLSNIAHWGHVGGFLVGVATMYLMIRQARRRQIVVDPMTPHEQPVETPHTER